MMKNKKVIIAIVAVLVAGFAYKTQFAKPSTPAPKPKVDGKVYILPKEFLVNLSDGKYAKLQVGFVMAPHDTSTVAAGGHGAAPTPPEGYGAMGQEGIVRDLITGVLTDATDKQLIEEEGREELKKKILKVLKKKTDVKVEEILFSDLTVQ
jgi:flagellar FliL protein